GVRILPLVYVFLFRSLHHPYVRFFPPRRSSDLRAPGRPPRRGSSPASTGGFRPACPPATAPSTGPAAAPPACPTGARTPGRPDRSEEHTSELQSRENLVCRLLLEKKKAF